MWSEYFAMAQRVTDTLGRNRAVADLRPGDFGRLRAAAAKDLGPIALGKFITMARSMFGFAHTADLIEKPVKFGDEFNKPTKKVLRGVRNARGERMISPADCRKLIETAKPQLAAMIYLALNCGFGQSDCAALQRATLAKRPGWIDFPRPKTGIERRCPLWPETIAALAAVEAIRPAPHNKDDADCVFLTRCGFRWVRFIDRGTKRVGVNIDSILQEFKKCAKDAKVKLPAGAFYTLRHVHRTIADATRDRAAIDLIMGHGDASMGAHYRERIDDERLQAVVDHVRAWLLETKPVDPKKPAAEDDDVDQASANVAIVGRPVLRLVG
jgi:integrase